MQVTESACSIDEVDKMVKTRFGSEGKAAATRKQNWAIRKSTRATVIHDLSNDRQFQVEPISVPPSFARGKDCGWASPLPFSESVGVHQWLRFLVI